MLLKSWQSLLQGFFFWAGKQLQENLWRLLQRLFTEVTYVFPLVICKACLKKSYSNTTYKFLLDWKYGNLRIFGRFLHFVQGSFWRPNLMKSGRKICLFTKSIDANFELNRFNKTFHVGSTTVHHSFWFIRGYQQEFLNNTAQHVFVWLLNLMLFSKIS